ncbi:MAG TPA: SRPBCC family protein [Bdellovibrio sp.]
MLIKASLGLGVVVVGFIAYVATREGKFHYERSGVIDASAEKIFPYISDFKKGGEWSPYEKMDPNMKKNFVGPDAQVGSVMEFDGNQEAGSGKLEILKIVPNESVEIKLTMLKPFHAENLVVYKLTPEGEGTRFSWSMSGDSGFLGKLINVFIDCEKMVADQFSVGINNLKNLLEAQN